jgi:carboxymethylenebutenolidase
VVQQGRLGSCRQPRDRPSVNATRSGAKAALDAARLKYELITFDQADHAFFNDTGARFSPHAATEVWRRTLNWFDDAVHRRG